MKLNTIALDQPLGPKAPNTPRGGNCGFQLAYAQVLRDHYAPRAHDAATAQASRAQDSAPPPDDAEHAVRAGETLYAIVRARLATIGAHANPKASTQGVQQIAHANRIHNPDRIYVAQKLNLSTPESSMSH